MYNNKNSILYPYYLFALIVLGYLLVACSSDSESTSDITLKTNISVESDAFHVMDNIELVFSSAINSETITNANITLTDSDNNARVKVHLTYSEFLKTVFVDPVSILNWSDIILEKTILEQENTLSNKQVYFHV